MASHFASTKKWRKIIISKKNQLNYEYKWLIHNSTHFVKLDMVTLLYIWLSLLSLRYCIGGRRAQGAAGLSGSAAGPRRRRKRMRRVGRRSRSIGSMYSTRPKHSLVVWHCLKNGKKIQNYLRYKTSSGNGWWQQVMRALPHSSILT